MNQHKSRGRLVMVSAAFVVSLTCLPVPSVEAAQTSCEGLASLVLPHATITAAQLVPAGAFTPPAVGRRGGNRGPAPEAQGAAEGRGGAQARGGGRGAAVYQKLPAFCRVAATLTPSSDSDIKVEVWLPSAGWNGKFQAVGNGGWAGTISYPALAEAVAAGYAGASTDTGHVGGSAEFAYGHPEKLIDLAYRSHHEMAVKAKTIINAHYGSAPKLSFWNGCSQGGRQGLVAAQMYPADFDAIAAGAAAWNFANLYAGRIALNRFVNRSPDSNIPSSKYPMIHDAVINACDATDGVQDGILENPARCRFDPQVLQCKDADGPSCLTTAQVETARAIYAPVTHPKTGAVVYEGMPPGAELGWGITAGPAPQGLVLDAFKYIVFDPAWDYQRFDRAADIDRTFKALQPMASNDANLKPFFARGGKLLLYHGWTDPQSPPDHTIAYFNAVVSRLGKGVIGRSIQLYMVPGMDHCQGGVGPDTFDKVAPLEQWIATGKAPESIIASHLTDGKVDRTRPLCAYGKVAKWKGTGSTDDAANFICAAGSTRSNAR
jgi:feruloyl esterase